jgi:NADH-quinone oxidoreductase subunit E
MSLKEATSSQMDEIIARYPRSRSAIMPLLHLVQSVEGYVTPEGIELVAEKLGLSNAEVSAVATFYTQYKRRPIGEYHVGICTNTLCAVMGGDAIFSGLKEHLGIGNDETTADGKVSLEHIECNAACDYAPVDNQTVESARSLVDALRAGDPPAPTRGPNKLPTWKENSAVLAGINDGHANEGVQAGPASLAGLNIATNESGGQR